MRPPFCCAIYFVVIAAYGLAHPGRAIRALAFRKGSSFFHRLNYKINSLPYTTIFAQAAGFKVAWELPSAGGHRVVRTVSDIHECAELVYESHGFNGRSCLLKSICQALQYAERKDGVTGKILKSLAGSYINNATGHEDPLLCEHHTKNCPLQLIGFNGTRMIRERINAFADMPSAYRQLSILVGCLNCLVLCADPTIVHENTTEIDVAPRILSRPKRYLIFPQGSNFQLVYCLTIGAYGRDGDLVLGLTAALAWELPSKVDTRISNLLHRRSRSAVYPKMEALLQSAGLDGRSCVMRALCEAGRRNPTQVGTGTFVQELLHAIFTLPRDGAGFERAEDRAYDRAYETDGNCERLYSTCRYSIYDADF